MKFNLKKNLFPIFLGTVAVLLLLDTLVRVWFGFQLEFDSTNFNNVVTPIGTILSTILFFIALRLTIKQNGMILSQNLKPHFDKEIESVRELLNRRMKLPLGEDETYSDLDVVTVFYQVYTFLKTNNEYNNDLGDSYNRIHHNLSYYSKRIYYSEIFFLQSFYIHGIVGFNSVIELINHINRSKLGIEEKKLYKRSINQEFISRYIAFIQMMEVSNQEYLIPNVWFPMDSERIEFVQFTSWGIREQYNYLMKALESEGTP